MTFLFPVRSQQGGAMEGRPPAPARVSSMFRRLMVRVTPAERLAAEGKEREREKDERPPPAAGAEVEVGSVGLDRMVLSFMEDSAAVAERPPRGRCAGNCFNGNQDGSDDEDFDFLPSASAPTAAPAATGDALELLKGLVQCASTAERNLLADASRIAERCGKGGGGSGRKKADVRRAVADGLRALGYDAAVCVSRWDKAPSHPAGEHEYIDAVVAGSGAASVRLMVEVDFRSEFEVARPTKVYRAALQALPPLFVGTPDRLGRVVALVADAARQSLRKRGLHFPPWRKPEYMRAKWLSPHARAGVPDTPPLTTTLATPVSAASFSGEFELRFDEKPKAPDGTAREDGEEKKITVVVSPSPSPWHPVEAEASATSPPQAKGKVVTGLASVL
ncbi:hypothetical protein SETIT_2G057200v2 [Setaria italica]|uniref:DUF506 domain-containing protein n=1 Tax=Setaria italica TaxID=4555 RepID=K3ZU38_SETIT|nr:uncharacterized protein LOC101770761 [Setaria italica]RCV09781.1 hypothetical protein SETIT_2G057200v2 [Setaria italica]